MGAAYRPGPVEEQFANSVDELERRICTLTSTELLHFVEWVTLFPRRTYQSDTLLSLLRAATDILEEREKARDFSEYDKLTALDTILRITNRNRKRMGENECDDDLA